jgi:DNA-binding XRE family transcriptional regulator
VNRQPAIEVGAVKRAVRERDGHACTQCGMTDDEHRDQFGRGLEIHRLTPGSIYTVEGCVTLCQPCHGPQPRRPRGSPDLALGPHAKPAGRDLIPGFADAMRRGRESHGWSVADLARETGLSANHLHALEREARAPSAKAAIDIMNALGWKGFADAIGIPADILG